MLPLAPLALGGCSAFENLGGGKKVSPDEFKIVSHSPLTMPPNAELRPPRPGRAPAAGSDAGRPGQGGAVAGAGAGRSQQATGTGPDPGRTSSEQALVRRRAAAASIPTSAAGSTRDTKTLTEKDNTFIDSLIFWQDTPPPACVVDPTKEQQRLRDAQAAGQTVAGATPTIERRKRGLLEGIF